MADYIDGAEGTGFQKAQGLFKAVPKFETTLWMFKLSLVMPTEYFDSTNYLWQYVTYEESTGTVPKQTISCGLFIGNATSAEVIEYDETFDATTETDLPPSSTNGAAQVEDQSYGPGDIEDMGLLPDTNGKSKQTCVAQVEVPPEEAEAFFNKDYTITVGGRVYEGKESTVFSDLAPLTYSYTIPAADFTFAPFEDQTTDTQILVSEEFFYPADDYLGVAGEAKQSLFAGFETQPYDDTASDALGFAFELLAPTEVFTTGKVVYQWLTFAKADDFKSNPMSVGCVSKVNNPYVAEV